MLKGDYIYFKFKNLIWLYWKIAIFYDHVSDQIKNGVFWY
jgi:hypothetical protein